MNPHTEVIIGLGGNIGQPLAAMREALRKIDSHALCKITRVSSVWQTPPWGITDQPDFLNSCATLTTALSARPFLALCHEIEHELKRVRDVRWGPRSIDIDILFFGDQIINEAGLVVPHPRIAQRAFVLVPLLEISTGLCIGAQTVADLAATCDQTGMKICQKMGWFERPIDTPPH